MRLLSAPTLRTIEAEQSMRSTLVATVVLGSALVSGSAGVNARPVANPTATLPFGALIGHLQPRAPQFSPHSPAEHNVQQQMSMFDAHQHKLDERLDKRLNICRC
jgi:hypothetical protein